MASELENKFIRYIIGLERELCILNTQYRLLVFLSDAKYERRNEYRFARYFFHSVINSLFTDVLLISTKLLESNRSDKNIPDFLHFIDCNLALFAPQAIKTRLGFSKTNEIQNRGYFGDSSFVFVARSKLVELEPIFENLKKKRDKYYAHYDKWCFDDPKKIKTTTSVTRNDMEKIISICFSIIDHYSVAFNGEHLSISTTDRFDVTDIFDLIEQHINDTRLRSKIKK